MIKITQIQLKSLPERDGERNEAFSEKRKNTGNVTQLCCANSKTRKERQRTKQKI